MKFLKVKAVVNKKTGQINISLPRKQLSLEMKNKILDMKQLKIKIKDFK